MRVLLIEDEPTTAKSIELMLGTDPQGRTWPRPPQDVLNIVFMNPDRDARRGGFFPQGVQGVVRHAMQQQPSRRV